MEQTIDKWFGYIHKRISFIEESSTIEKFDFQVTNKFFRAIYSKGKVFSQFKEALYSPQKSDLQCLDLTILCIDKEQNFGIPAFSVTKKSFNSYGRFVDLEGMTQEFLSEPSGKILAIDLKRKIAIYYIPNESKIPSWDYSSPFREFIHFWGLHNKVLLLHGSSIFHKKAGGIVFPGKSGLGKSTTCLMAMNAGYKSCGDDYILISLDKSLCVYALYRTFKWSLSDIMPIPNFLQKIPFKFEEKKNKRIYFLPQKSSNICKKFNLNKILFIKKNNKCEEKISSFWAFANLAHSTLEQSSSQYQRTFSMLKYMLDKSFYCKFNLGFGEEKLMQSLESLKIKNQKLLSIVISVYNGEKGIGEAIKSIQNQKQNHFELEVIVLNNASTDATQKIVNQVAKEDPRIRIIHFKSKKTLSESRNYGISKAQGEWLCFLDHDDIWTNNKINEQYSFLSQNLEYDYVLCNQIMKLSSGHVVPAWVQESWLSKPEPSITLQALMIRKKTFLKVGLFDKNLSVATDLDWFIRAKACGLKSFIISSTYVVRGVHQDNVCRYVDIAKKERLTILRKKLHAGSINV